MSDGSLVSLRARAERREKLRRACEDGARLYDKSMHDVDGFLSVADWNRIHGILTLDLPDALGLVDEAVAALEAAEQDRDDWKNAALQDRSLFEAAEARLLAAQQGLREAKDDLRAVAADGWDSSRWTRAENAIAKVRAALAAVGRVPAQEDKP